MKIDYGMMLVGGVDEKVHHIPLYQAHNRIKSYKNSL